MNWIVIRILIVSALALATGYASAEVSPDYLIIFGRTSSASGGVAVTNFLLVQAGSALLIQTGSKFKIK